MMFSASEFIDIFTEEDMFLHNLAVSMFPDYQCHILDEPLQ